MRSISTRFPGTKKTTSACLRACAPPACCGGRRLVYGEDGQPEPYDKLIIATGSRPFIPPMEGTTMPDGSFKPGVFVFRTLDDCREIAEYAQGKESAAVIGGGLLGLEAARGLAELRPGRERRSSGRPSDAAAARSRLPGAILKAPAWRSWESRCF